MKLPPNTLVLQRRWAVPTNRPTEQRLWGESQYHAELATAVLDWLKDGGAATVRYGGRQERLITSTPPGGVGLMEYTLTVYLTPVPED